MAQRVCKTQAFYNKSQNHNYVNYRRAFIYSTLNGAKALGIDHKTGSLEVGKSFDACIGSVRKSFFLD